MSDAETTKAERGTLWIIAVIAGAKLLLHLHTNALSGYGIFRDELYYLACAEHLSFGYVDHPPLSIWILAGWRSLMGDSIFALRFLPALAGAGTVLLTGLLARGLGGGRFAILAAGTAALVSPIMLAMNSVYSMNAFDFVFWGLAALLMLRLLRGAKPGIWLWIGVILGLALLNKIGNLWLGLGIYAGVLFSPQRKQLRTWQPWAGGLIAALMFLPYVHWNWTHDLAHLEFIRNATAGKYSGLTRMDFLGLQFLLNNPVTVPVWLAGLWYYFASPAGRAFRPLGVLYAAALAVLLANAHSKAEYLATAYVPLFAAGPVMLERWLSSGRWRRLRPIMIGILMTGLALAPAVTPLLPVETYIRYAEAIGLEPGTSESKQLDRLPQFYADMFGWEQKAKDVAATFHMLTPDEKARCAIFGDNYGRCGAIDFFGPKYGLPKSIGRHNNYWIWGPRDYTGELMMILGGDLKDKQEIFESVEIVGRSACEYCMPYENNLNIYLCRGLKTTLRESWPRLRHFE